MARIHASTAIMIRVVAGNNNRPSSAAGLRVCMRRKRTSCYCVTALQARECQLKRLEILVSLEMICLKLLGVHRSRDKGSCKLVRLEKLLLISSLGRRFAQTPTTTATSTLLVIVHVHCNQDVTIEGRQYISSPVICQEVKSRGCDDKS